MTAENETNLRNAARAGICIAEDILAALDGLEALRTEVALLRITAADDSTDDQRVQAYDEWREKYGGG